MTFDISKFYKKIDILDKGFIELIDGPKEDPKVKIVNAARVSFLKEIKELKDRDIKLIKFMNDHGHYSVFRHSHFTFRWKAPLFVFRQAWKYQIGSEWENEDELGKSVIIPSTCWNEACLDEDTLIYIEKTWGGKKSIYKVKIKDIYRRFHANSPSLKKDRLRCLNEDTMIFETSTIKDVLDRGIQDVFLITLEDGKTIKCTGSHRIYTNNGWSKVKDCLNPVMTENIVSFNPDILFATNGKKIVKLVPKKKKTGQCFKFKPKYSKVVNIEYIGKKQCYDIEMNGNYKNFIANGIVVHNSGRYVKFEPEFYIPPEIRLQSKDNKQGSHGKLDKLPNGEDPVKFFEESCIRQYNDYLYMVEAGAAKEQCRSILPQGIYTQCIWTASLQTLMFFLEQRLKDDAQYEIRSYAKGIKELIAPIYEPLSLF